MRTFFSIVVSMTAIIVWMESSMAQPVPPSGSKPAVQFTLDGEGLARGGFWKSTPVFADVNQDGALDLAAIPRLGDGARVWLGDGSGKWTDASSGLGPSQSCGGGVDFGDINKDGHLDLAVADHCSGVYVYLGDGKGNWKAVTEQRNPEASAPKAPQDSHNDETGNAFIGSEDLAVGDVNEDTFPDLVVASADQGGFTVYLGDGTGKNWKEAKADGLPSADDLEAYDEDQGGWANQVLLRDINKDGHLDVVAGYYAGPRVWLGDGKGQWKAYSQGLPTPTIGGLFRGVAVGDIDEDGHPDLAVANDVNGPEVFLQRDGSWERTPDVLPSMQGGAVGLDLGDLDKDGHLDLLVAGRKTKGKGSIYGFFVCLGDGKGGWKELEGTQLPDKGLSVTWGVALADVNKDGRLDFAAGTGGIVVDDSRRKLPPGKAVQPGQAPNTVPELSVPRMQVWLNQKS